MNFDRIYKYSAFLVCALLIFIYGIATEKYKIFPYSVVYYFKDSLSLVYREFPVILGIKPIHFLEEARYDGEGVTRLDESQIQPGWTLISGYFDGTNGLRLLRPDGSAVRQWPVRFSEIFPDPDFIEPPSDRPATDWNIDIHGALALPDGSVVFNFEYGGTVKLDRCGEVQWAVRHATHHSIDPSANGGFWIPGRRYVEEDSAFPRVDAPYYDDLILLVSPDGDILKEISVPALLFKNDLHALLFANGKHWMELPDELEIVHVNDVEELSADMAEHFPQFAAGDLLLSLRDLNLVMVIDPQTEQVRWYKTGPWLRQHDPDFNAKGRISIFNNNSDDTKTGRIFGGSNIIEIDPSNDKTTILYGDRPDQKIFTNIRGKHQALENGNLLITEFSAGRVIEVNSDGNIVWEFISRFDEDEVAEIADAIRYPEDYFNVTDWTCE